jgi:hypothetical protein
MLGIPIPNPTPRAILSDSLRPFEDEVLGIFELSAALALVSVGTDELEEIAAFELSIPVAATVIGLVEGALLATDGATLGKTTPAAVLQ